MHVNPATTQHNRLRLSLMSVGLHVCMSTLRQHNITGYGCLWWGPAYTCACQPCDNTTSQVTVVFDECRLTRVHVNPETTQHNRLRLSLMRAGLHVCMSTLRQHNITCYGCLWWAPAYTCACQPCDNTTSHVTVVFDEGRLTRVHVNPATTQHNITGYGCLWWVPAYTCACQPWDNTT